MQQELFIAAHSYTIFVLIKVMLFQSHSLVTQKNCHQNIILHVVDQWEDSLWRESCFFKRLVKKD